MLGIVLPLTVTVIAAEFAVAAALVVLSLAFGAPRSRAAWRAAWRLAPVGWSALAAVAALGVVLGEPAWLWGIPLTLVYGACCAPAAFGLLALIASGALERNGRLGAARRLARRSVPWTLGGSALAIFASLMVWSTPVTQAMLALAGALGGLGGLSRKPRPAGLVALALHVAALARAA